MSSSKRRNRTKRSAQSRSRATTSRSQPQQENGYDSSDEQAVQDEFPGWTIEEHQAEIEGIELEFQRLGKQHYETALSRIETQIHDIGQGSDKIYKKKLSTIEKSYRESCQALDDEKGAELDAIARTCEAQIYNLESIFAEDKELFKEILIKKLKNVAARRAMLAAMPDYGDDSPAKKGDKKRRKSTSAEQSGHAYTSGSQALNGAPHPVTLNGVPRDHRSGGDGSHAAHGDGIAGAVHTDSPSQRGRKRKNSTQAQKPAVTQWRNELASPIIYMLSETEILEDLSCISTS
eukprot:m.212834 g.212834  ORF g.212834 m.212834 type:complete len:291 (-) comp19052_c1_seq1:87-959(-)